MAKSKHGVEHRPHFKEIEKWYKARLERYERWKHQQQKEHKKGR